MLYGVVDIGSNTVKLNVYNSRDNDISVEFSEKENLGLLFYINNGKLTDEGIEELVTVLKEMKNDLDYLKINSYSFFSTASLRNIENSAEVIQIIKDKVNIEIDLLSGEEEGELSFCGSISTIQKDNGILIDLGGGSVEIVLFKNRKIDEKYSIPVGSLKMYNDYVSDIIPNKKECNLIKERIYSELDKIGLNNEEKIPFMCGIGGSIRAIKKILVNLNLQKKKADLIDVKLLKQLKEELKLNESNRNNYIYYKILHVKPSRIHTLVPALLIVESITSYFGCEEIQISKFSVREGYLYKKMLNRYLNMSKWDYSFTQNRELSWLKFNERVLEEAEDASVPLLERLKYVSIFTSNLDEFYMVRCGSLYDLSLIDEDYIDNKTGLNAQDQLDDIFERTKFLYKRRDDVYKSLNSSLKEEGIYDLDFEDLTKSERKFINKFFFNCIFPVLSPQVIDVHHPFPHLLNKSLNVMLIIRDKGKTLYGLIPIPSSLPRIIYFPKDEMRFILLEKIIYEYVNEIFSNYNVEFKTIVSVTRNADITLSNSQIDEDEDYKGT